jgi:hypothetical protein
VLAGEGDQVVDVGTVLEEGNVFGLHQPVDGGVGDAGAEGAGDGEGVGDVADGGELDEEEAGHFSNAEL